MGRFGRFLLDLIGEAVGEAIFEGILYVVVGGPIWLVQRFFGPFKESDGVFVGLGALALLGLVMFVAVGVSRHRRRRR